MQTININAITDLNIRKKIWLEKSSVKKDCCWILEFKANAKD